MSIKKSFISIKSLVFLVTILLSQACSTEKSPHEKLNGRWTSDIMTINIDFEDGTYSGVALGKQFNQEIELVSESPEVVVFRTDGDKITAQFQSDGAMLLTKEGGIPIKFQRAK